MHRTFQWLKQNIPEVYFIGALLCCITPHFLWWGNFVLLGLAGILLIQLLWQPGWLYWCTAILFGFGNLFFLLALLSEFREFPRWNSETAQLIGVGLFLFILNCLMILLIARKGNRIAPVF